MDYSITEFNKFTGEITVNFGSGFALMKIKLPVDGNNNVPIGEELDKLIQSLAPVRTSNEFINSTVQDSVSVNNSEDIIKLIVNSENTTEQVDISFFNSKINAINELTTNLVNTKALFITSLPNQDYSYISKAYQAIEFKNLNYTGTVPPYIAEEIILTKESAKTCTDNIISRYEKWINDIDPKLEAIRTFNINKIIQATTAEELNLIKIEYINLLSNIKTSYKDYYSTLSKFYLSNA